ncbi:spore germination protein (amino acid permease) [Natronincola peptidivorans]|uniref:Spore germination protein (Amino acid permease) n=1 Tax=Natronincola peptidivorans TaxID=426128 RepID=A0A1I0F2Y2_9FIRM|nr:endospore germination permease [Natronincola peptidivorans]SET52255.1 spore germination protein (amino acid permease) [Natronincola peptidivorans]
MEISDGKIDRREFFAIIVILIASKFTDLTATIILRTGRTAAWILPIISFIVIILPFLATLALLKRFKKKNFIEIIYAIAGKYLGFVIAISLFFILLSATAINLRNYADAVSTMFYPNTPVAFFILLGAVVSYFIANRGLEGIGRTASLLLPCFAISLLLLIVLTWQHFQDSYLFPLLGPGVVALLKDGLVYSTIFADIIVMAVLFPFVKDYRSYRTASIRGLIVSAFLVSLFLLIYIIVFDFHPATVVNHPFHQLNRRAQLGPFITNVEAIFFFFWILAKTLRFAIYFYVMAIILGYSLTLKEFEPLILPLAGLTAMLSLIPENIVEGTLDFRDNFLLQRSWLYFITVPIVLWFISKWREKSKDESL